MENPYKNFPLPIADEQEVFKYPKSKELYLYLKNQSHCVFTLGRCFLTVEKHVSIDDFPIDNFSPMAISIYPDPTLCSFSEALANKKVILIDVNKYGLNAVCGDHPGWGNQHYYFEYAPFCVGASDHFDPINIIYAINTLHRSLNEAKKHPFEYLDQSKDKYKNHPELLKMIDDYNSIGSKINAYLEKLPNTMQKFKTN